MNTQQNRVSASEIWDALTALKDLGGAKAKTPELLHHRTSAKGCGSDCCVFGIHEKRALAKEMIGIIKVIIPTISCTSIPW